MGPRSCLCRPRHGAITHVDYSGLVRWAARHDVVVSVDRSVGEFLVEGQDLLTLWGTSELGADESQKVYRFVGVGPQRVTRQDVAFGIRQLVDIIDRALSPVVNDPTTALPCLQELHRVLRHLVQQASPSPYIADDQGQVRVVHHPQSVSDLVQLAVREPAHYGQDSLRMVPGLRAMLEDLQQVTANRYRNTIERLLLTLPGADEGPRPEHPGRA
ncbi:DUF2254 family protein [Citricoccus alkalitolerans]|uniref:DUF2254 family protein n=1 Tax=Citricoccus alkalitolerans TaxID=246603 RepID=A0ABV8Y1G1_9MICC